MSEARSAAIDWAKRYALPLWARLGWDHEKGGFVERLDEAGKPDPEAVRRVRVQARQVYVYAHAAILGWHDGAADIAHAGFAWWLTHCRQDGGGFKRLVARDGATVEAGVDAYDQAFGLLALAWMYRLTGDAQIGALIRDEMAFADDRLLDPATGGWFENTERTTPRRQNPQMHAFEAMLALYEATGDAAYLARAERFLALLETKLVDPHKDFLLEYFDDVFAPLNVEAGRVVEPGHHFEWVWLLHAYARLKGAAPHRLAGRLFDWAMRYGRDAQGFAVDECDRSGAPRGGTRRLWPQTELIKAHLAREEAGVDPAAGRGADAALEALMRTYCTRAPEGGWVDRFDGTGALMDGRMPSSTFYHIFCAIAEAARVSAARP